LGPGHGAPLALRMLRNAIYKQVLVRLRVLSLKGLTTVCEEYGNHRLVNNEPFAISSSHKVSLTVAYRSAPWGEHEYRMDGRRKCAIPAGRSSARWRCVSLRNESVHLSVASQCLEYALENHVTTHLGGCSERERRRILRERRRRRVSTLTLRSTLTRVLECVIISPRPHLELSMNWTMRPSVVARLARRRVSPSLGLHPHQRCRTVTA